MEKTAVVADSNSGWNDPQIWKEQTDKWKIL